MSPAFHALYCATRTLTTSSSVREAVWSGLDWSAAGAPDVDCESEVPGCAVDWDDGESDCPRAAAANSNSGHSKRTAMFRGVERDVLRIMRMAPSAMRAV